MKKKSLYYPFYYLFYRLDRINTAMFGDKTDEVGNWPLVGAISTFQYLNLNYIELAIDYFYKDYITYNSTYTAVSGVFILLLNYRMLVWKGRDKEIITMFENETEQERKRGVILIWIYLVATFSVIFVTLALK